jgi:hypothetical protein
MIVGGRNGNVRLPVRLMLVKISNVQLANIQNVMIPLILAVHVSLTINPISVVQFQSLRMMTRFVDTSMKRIVEVHRLGGDGMLKMKLLTIVNSLLSMQPKGGKK